MSGEKSNHLFSIFTTTEISAGMEVLWCYLVGYLPYLGLSDGASANVHPVAVVICKSMYNEYQNTCAELIRN